MRRLLAVAALAALLLGGCGIPDETKVTVVGAGPKPLGAQIPITGDGRESWGPAGLAISLSEK